MKFLNQIVEELLSKNSDLSGYNLVFPGKRPIVFFKKILEEKQYSGFLPNFYTIEEIITQLSDLQEVKGVSLWLFAYNQYKNIDPSEDFYNFLKWFPTVLKDWDDMLKFSEDDLQILDYMLYEERIKNWSETLGDHPNSARQKFQNFWRKQAQFLPILKAKLLEKNWGTSGIIHQKTKQKIENFAKNTSETYVFCGFNALTPVEEQLIRTLLQWDKALVYFQTDQYYMEDENQEAGNFLRNYKKNWKEFNKSRSFLWEDNKFIKDKNIKLFEVSGNISQTKVLPEILQEIKPENYSNTALILLDENLLPASLDSLSAVEKLNITMGFPLKNLAFSNAIKQLFYIQKQLEKGSTSYYYKDVVTVLENLPNNTEDQDILNHFKQSILEKNMVYLSEKRMQEYLGTLSYFNLFLKPKHTEDYLDQLTNYCFQIKFKELDDIQYENIALFEKTFKLLKQQLSDYDFPIKLETLEVLINQLVNKESIDFKGEPLEGLQVMGLLESRLLNFENIILLSVNEGKLPLGNSQNTFLPFNVRKQFNLHTFLENDGIYAYHFYRLLQESKNVYLLYNSLSSGINTGEKSRFISQLEIESPHKIEHFIIENTSEPVEDKLILVEKTEVVQNQLELWKQKISASHLINYIYNPVDFYLSYVLKTRETDEIEEELSQRNYGNLIHKSLEFLYYKIKGKILVEKDLLDLLNQTDLALDFAIKELNHQPEFYNKGMNYIHKSIAKRVVENIINYDLNLVKEGNTLEIIDLERKFTDLPFLIDEDQIDVVNFYGYIDRIDQLNGTIRIIDYKTAKPKNLNLKFTDKNFETLLNQKNYIQALQLSIYLYYAKHQKEFSKKNIEAGIWSFADVNSGVQSLNFEEGDLETAMLSIKNIILEILNPEIPFEETEKITFEA